MADIFNAKVYKPDADNLKIDVGGAIKYNGAAMNVVSGEVTLDGSNPTTVATGLTTISGAVAVVKKATSPADDPVALTVDYSGGNLSIYAWKTDGADPTLIASTNNSAVISYIAVGA